MLVINHSSSQVPVGGLTGQVPVKLSGTDYDLGWFSGLSLDPLTGRIGVGTNAPQSQFDIDAVGTAQAGLNIKTDINVNVFQYKKTDGSNLLRATYDGFNFHHYFGSNIFYNLTGKHFTISGNGQPSILSITNGARLFLDTDNIGALANLNIGALGSSYATAAVPLSKTVAIATNTWAWNGVSGSVIRSLLTQTQTQRSANAGDAIFEFVSNDFGTILSMDLLSGDVGIGSNAPSEKLHVAGTALAYNVVRWITKSAAYTASAGDGIFANTTTAAFTVTLPTGALGQVIEVKDNGNNFATNNLTVGSFVLATNGEYAKFVHNGTAWMRL